MRSSFDPCSAMKEAGITDTCSHDAIMLCLSCPYEKCVLDKENRKNPDKTTKMKKLAVVLRGKGLSVEQIAKKLRLNSRTIYRYLR